MISSVVHELKTIPAPKKGNPPTDEQLEDRLHHLSISTKVLYLLVNLVKVSPCNYVVYTSLSPHEMPTASRVALTVKYALGFLTL